MTFLIPHYKNNRDSTLEPYLHLNRLTLMRVTRVSDLDFLQMYFQRGNMVFWKSQKWEF